MSLPSAPFVGTVYRAHNPRWACDPESGAGASRYGGRFNPPGVAALYTSLRPETAWLEAQQGFAFKSQPMTLCAYDVDCADILDLTSADIRESSGILLAELSCPWEDMADRNIEPPSWSIAKRLIAEGIAGIIAPSFANRANTNDHNLIFWKWTRDLPRKVRVIDDDNRLPKNDLSWT